MIPPARLDYERQVRGLRAVADAMRAEGADVERVARRLVDLRNALKARFRAQDDPAIVAIMEMRNRAKYGHPLGPGADALLAKYGSWEGVIEAACRPAAISGS